MGSKEMRSIASFPASREDRDADEGTDALRVTLNFNDSILN